ncbi:histidine kinase [Scytonema hofmannii PCC 7110]|uniref:histidine kinase n=1 Tax=Scytonema hofmannii PCC 7110 TaxID=128403 RepID=A0A139XFG1_9CYAN|nr:HAMP domain-containing sensor histidine kinase [Scytonema hofmannii]KYC43409.1 histidine kinase [Scytonema hofmannii PCC 7110]
MSQESSSRISPPFLSGSSNSDLGLESTLRELPAYNFFAETNCTGAEIAIYFDKYPLLPGVILVEEGKYMGMISRRRLLEFLIRPYGQELFLQQPLSVLYSYARTEILLLTETTPILAAIQLALRRSAELLGEPVVVHTAPDIYRLLDVQELNIASWQIRGIETQVRYERSQALMVQNDKMANLGRLVDGVAHEILDPLNFIWGNLAHVANYSQDLMKLVDAYEKENLPLSEETNQLKQEIELDFLQQDLSRAIASIRAGAERLKKLVTGLQTFCHIDEVYPKPTDIHANIDGIILLINSRITGEIEIVKNYGHLPPLSCFIGQLNQVFMNILSQAVDTLLNEAVRQQMHLETAVTAQKPRIEITTQVISRKVNLPDTPDSRWVSICIADNGPGMSQELQQQITDSFSIEKRADKETNLSVSYRIVKARHGGELNLYSELGKGTEFQILLPL